MLRSARFASFGLCFGLCIILLSGCGSPEGRAEKKEGSPITSREDSLMAVLSAAKASAAQGTSILRVDQIDSLAAQSQAEGVLDGGIAATPSPATTAPAPQATPSKAVSAAPASAGPPPPATASTLEEAIRLNAILQVDSGSAEDLRLDSLMALAQSKSYEYQRYVMTHTHTSLAAAAHQDIAKQKRLLRAIAAKTDERNLAAQKAKFIRIQRQRELKGLPPLPDSLGLLEPRAAN